MRVLIIVLLLIALGAGVYLGYVNTSRGDSPSVARPSTPAKKKVLPFSWPPKLGETYPDLELVDQTGKRVSLSQFKGKVILVEPIGMSCPACQAFADAKTHGPFEGIRPQQGLPSIEESMRKRAGLEIKSDKRIVFVQLLLYNMKMQAPSPKEGKAWADHFEMDRSRNNIVLVGDPGMIGKASYNMIPGFQLIDESFILRADSTGHHPKDNLWDKLIPLAKELVE